MNKIKFYPLVLWIWKLRRTGGWGCPRPPKWGAHLGLRPPWRLLEPWAPACLCGWLVCHSPVGRGKMKVKIKLVNLTNAGPREFHSEFSLSLIFGVSQSTWKDMAFPTWSRLQISSVHWVFRLHIAFFQLHLFFSFILHFYEAQFLPWYHVIFFFFFSPLAQPSPVLIISFFKEKNVLASVLLPSLSPS